ncbi:MAG: hypothetical protein EOR94_29765 [Mesorhizobium sp.]|nr:MAG: hypothetical protein EOR94_29765 [Mesorhizobium sp.]
MADAVAVKRTLQAAKVKALGRAAPRVVAALASRGLAIARIANPGSSFVIGSLPIVRLQDGKRTLDDPGVEAWLPIAHDVAVSPGGAANQEIFADIDNQNVDLLNQYVFRQSTEIAGRSRELLSSLVEKG